MNELLVWFGGCLGVFYLTYFMNYHGFLLKNVKLPVVGALVFAVMWVSGIAALVLTIILFTRVYFGV